VILLDSTILIDVLRDRTGRARQALEDRLGDETLALTRMTQFEVMRGCRDQRQWDRLARYLGGHPVVETGDATWEEAARIDFELRKQGKTVRSGIDCVIAQIAIEHERMLLHNDADFELIATIRPLKHERMDIKQTRSKSAKS
jgi:predicted nucleic acid-binding protein